MFVNYALVVKFMRMSVLANAIFLRIINFSPDDAFFSLVKPFYFTHF